MPSEKTTKIHRRARKRLPGGSQQRARGHRDADAKLPKQFVPKFWHDADQRLGIIREVKRRVDRMKEDVGADSVQKELLAEKAAFLSIVLETQEREAAEGIAELDVGKWVQAVNALTGLLRALGLEKAGTSVVSLNDYAKEKEKRATERAKARLAKAK